MGNGAPGMGSSYRPILDSTELTVRHRRRRRPAPGEEQTPPARGTMGSPEPEPTVATDLPLTDPRDIARNRCRDHLLAVLVYLAPARERAVDRVECELLQDLRHALNLGGGERNQVRVGP